MTNHLLLALLLTAMTAMTAPALHDFGLAAKGGTCRGLFATADGQGHDAVVIWLMDDVNRRLLQLDAHTGAAALVPSPFSSPGDAVYSALLSARGKCYAHFGNHFVEYDPAQKQFTFSQQNPHQTAMAMAEDARGLIWSATYPDCGLVAFDPATRVFTDYGCLNQENWAQYPRGLAVAADGWIYVGLGETRGQLLAFDPRTRQTRALLEPAERPAPGLLLPRAYVNGAICARLVSQTWFRLDAGRKIRLEQPPDAPLAARRTGDQNFQWRSFPSGRQLSSFDLLDGKMTILDPKTGQTAATAFDFPKTGAPMMSIDINADGIAAGGSFFPFRFATLDPRTGRTTDEPADLQCNAILAAGKFFYLGGYSGGQLLRYDPQRPWTLKNPMRITAPNWNDNPVFYGKADPDINRPACLAITPDGRTLLMGGTPAYGRTGGGLAILDTASGKFTVIPHAQLAPDEAPAAIAALSNRELLIGTTVAPGTGGEIKAKSASLLLFNLETRKTFWTGKPLGEDIQAVLNLLTLPDGAVLGVTSAQELFRFDPLARQVTARQPFSSAGLAVGAQAPRLLFLDHGKCFLLLTTGVAECNPVTCRITRFFPIPGGIQQGAIRNGAFFFISQTHWKSCPLTELNPK